MSPLLSKIFFLPARIWAWVLGSLPAVPVRLVLNPPTILRIVYPSIAVVSAVMAGMLKVALKSSILRSKSSEVKSRLT